MVRRAHGRGERGGICGFAYPAIEYALSPFRVSCEALVPPKFKIRRHRDRMLCFGRPARVLVVLPSPYRELTRPLLKYIKRLERQEHDDVITVVLPEFIPAKWWQHILHNQSSLLLKGALLFRQGVIVTSVPYHLKHQPHRNGKAQRS